jgi:hypothetical protein
MRMSEEKSQEPARVLGGVARMGLARRAQGARGRRCGVIVDDEQRSDRRATPMRPSGSGFARASAALPLLILGQAPRGTARMSEAATIQGNRGFPHVFQSDFMN